LGAVGSTNFDSQHSNLSVKLVGTKIEGKKGQSMLIIDIVLDQLVSDDANLMCTLLYTSLSTWQNHFKKPLPPNMRLQVDGVSSNWGSTTFGFINYLMMEGVVKKLAVARQPVGNTHNSLDGIFGGIRRYFDGVNAKWKTLTQFHDLLEDSLAPHRARGVVVVIRVVKDVLDFKNWLSSAIDPKLALYGRHGKNNYNPGMHYME
jgi:hypothetical protein